MHLEEKGAVLHYPEVIHGHSQRVHHFSINGFIFQVYEIHLLSDSLKSSFWAKSSQVSTNMSMGLICHLKAKHYDSGIQASTHKERCVLVTHSGVQWNSKRQECQCSTVVFRKSAITYLTGRDTAVLCPTWDQTCIWNSEGTQKDWSSSLRIEITGTKWVSQETTTLTPLRAALNLLHF